jgi:mRNA interferase RelE/StbE
MNAIRRYEVYLEHRAEKDFKQLTPQVFNRIIVKIKSLAYNPRPKGCHKMVGSKDDWRIRIGNYRVIYEVDDKSKAIRVMFVKHRREAY